MSSDGYQFKGVLVGDAGVGKTNFLLRHRNKSFDPLYGPTMGAVISSLKFPSSSHGLLTFDCWDVTGVDEFAGFRGGYFAATECVIIMYDVTKRASLLNVPKWYEGVMNYASCDGGRIEEEEDMIPVVLVGGKIDITATVADIEAEEAAAAAAACSSSTPAAADEKTEEKNEDGTTATMTEEEKAEVYAAADKEAEAKADPTGRAREVYYDEEAKNNFEGIEDPRVRRFFQFHTANKTIQHFEVSSLADTGMKAPFLSLARSLLNAPSLEFVEENKKSE